MQTMEITLNNQHIKRVNDDDDDDDDEDDIHTIE